MNASLRGTGRQFWVAVRALLVFTVALGIVYPLVITGIGQLALPGPGERLGDHATRARSSAPA